MIFVALLITFAIYIVEVLAAFGILRALRRRRVCWALALLAVVVPLFCLNAAIFTLNTQSRLKELPTLPDGVTRRITRELWSGPLLLERDVQENGYPDGTSVFRRLRWNPWEVVLGGGLPTMIVCVIAGWVARRRERRLRPPPGPAS